MAWKVPAQDRPAAAFARRRRAPSDALGAPLHLGRGAAREGQQQDAVRVGAVDDEMRDAVGERVGLARARAGDHQQRPPVRADAMLDCRTLVGIEFLQIVHANHEGGGVRTTNHVSPFVRKCGALDPQPPAR